ncbi:MAG TPA: hypothetical protein VE127_16660 [Solirubrobacteraceae bacterium]|jgi:hypothetical protein|nr:hypothetical protein [Solirubrobacteraceae bacterium]
MTARGHDPGASAASGVIPEGARQAAARLSELFATDQRLCEQLNDAGRRLRGACEQLRDGPGLLEVFSPAGGRARRPAPATDAGARIHAAFCDYQHTCEQRRQLAVDVGELSQQLTDALRAAGFSESDARNLNVHALVTGGQQARP